jgi:uncharacterized membrane protein
MTLVKKDKSWFKSLTLNIRNRLISGIFVIVPFAVTVVIIRWLFLLLADLLRPVVAKTLDFLLQIHLIQQWPEIYVKYAVSLATILSLLLVLYLIGAIAKFVAGRRLLAVGENIVLKIPLAGTIYTATKQITSAISLQDNKSFTSVVLVQFPRQGIYAIGFLTGTIKDSLGNTYCKVFIPTTPNPTTGFFELIPDNEVLQTEISIEEAFKMIISGGIVSPDNLKITGRVNPIQNKSQ